VEEEETKEPQPGQIPAATAAAVNNKDLEANHSPETSASSSSDVSAALRQKAAHKRIQQGLPHGNKRNSRWSSWRFSSWRSEPPKETAGQKILYCGLGLCQLIVLIVVFLLVVVLIVVLASALSPKKKNKNKQAQQPTDDAQAAAVPSAAMVVHFLMEELFSFEFE